MKVYEIVKYDLKNKTLYTCKERPDLEFKEGTHGQSGRFYKKGTNHEAFYTHLWEYSTTPKAGALNPDERFMPYFADVTQDLPCSVTKYGLKPKTFKNCQLLTQKCNGYLEFWHEKTKQTLRIAMNSNTYEPVKNIEKKAAL